MRKATDCPRDEAGFCRIALLTWNGLCREDRRGNCKTYTAITSGALDPHEALTRAALNSAKGHRAWNRTAAPSSQREKGEG